VNAGDILDFAYNGGTHYGAFRNKVKVITPADESGNGNVFCLIAPYDEDNDCLRQFCPGRAVAHTIKVVGHFDPKAEQLSIAEAREILASRLGDNELAKFVVGDATTEQVCAYLEVYELGEVTFNEVTFQFEIHPEVKKSAFEIDDETITITKQDGSEIYLSATDPNTLVVTDDSGAEQSYSDPEVFAAALVRLMTS
jgi:hypothetical protein